MTWKLTVTPGFAFSYSVLSFSMSFIWPLFTVATLRVTAPPAPPVEPLPDCTAPDEQAVTVMATATAPVPSASMRLFASIPNSFGRQSLVPSVGPVRPALGGVISAWFS